MRRVILSIVLCTTFLTTAQTTRGITGETNWLRNWTNFKPKTTEYRETSNLLVGVINKNTTLYKKDVYLLMGTVYVTNGATLTIEPGTLIRGDYETNGTLVITQGSKIIAEGDETNPIVFTSNKASSERRAGDWGGLVPFGESPTNKFTARLDFDLDGQLNVYGGQKTESDSGILKYVRIEFAGKKAKVGKTLNGLSLAGVGNKTILDFIQVSFSNDDSFECYGGNINLNNVISFRSMRNDFNFTEGIQCKMNNSIAIKNPYVSDSEKSRCLKIQSYDVVSNADFTKKMTSVTVKNMTLINEDSDNAGLTREAVFVKENSFLAMSNSVVSGFNQGLVLEDKIKINQENLDKIKLQGMLFNNCNTYFASETDDNAIALKNWYNNEKFIIEYSKINTTEFFTDADLKKIPDFRMKLNQLSTGRLATN